MGYAIVYKGIYFIAGGFYFAKINEKLLEVVPKDRRVLKMAELSLDFAGNEAYRLRGRIGLIFLFALYVISYRYLYAVNVLFYWLFFFLIKPVIFSYILSFFFIEGIDDRKIFQHNKIRFSFSLPFLKIGILFWIFFFIILIAASSMFVRYEQKDLYMDLVSNLFVIFNYFWLIACMFEKNKIGLALKKALGAVIKYPAFYVGFFIFSFLDTVVFNRLMTEKNFLPLLSFGLLFSVGYLMLYKMIVLKFAKHGSLADRHNLLEAYFKQEPGSSEGGHDEVRELHDGRKCLILGILSFVPFLHLVAVFYSFKRLRAQKFARVRITAGLILGIFFTVMYLFAALGAIFPVKKKELLHADTLNYYLKPGMASREVQAALFNIQKRDYFQALEDFKSLKEDGTEAVCFAKGIIYEGLGDSDNAIGMFSKCVELNKDNAEAYFHLGYSLMYKQDRIAQARTSFIKVLSFYPQDPSTLKYIRLLNNGVYWPDDIVVKIIMIVVLLISFVLHEFFHAFTAYRCGDETQKANRRLTLNPFAHLDLFGSIILPVALLLRNSPVIFGWARPVSFDKSKFKHPDRDEALVSMMGPVTNVAVALAATFLLVLMGFVLSRAFGGFMSLNYFVPFAVTAIDGVPFARFWTYANIFLFELALMSLVLAAFNLLPIPPLDGSHLLPKYLSPKWQAKYETLRKYGLIFILIIVLTPVLDVVIGLPVMFYISFLNLVIAAPFGLG